VESEFLI